MLTPFQYPSREQRQYQYPLKTKIAAADVFKAQEQILKRKRKDKDPELTKEMRHHDIHNYMIMCLHTTHFIVSAHTNQLSSAYCIPLKAI